MLDGTRIPHSPGTVYRKEVLKNGKPTNGEYVDLAGQTFTIERGLINKVYLEDEWYEDLKDPHAVIEALGTASNVGADIFSFWQRIPDIEPKYAFHRESEALAVLPIKSYEDWWSKQLKSRTRNLIRKAEKRGVVIRKTNFDDEFVSAMTAIFNETPSRQGKPFWHYGKDCDTVKEQFSRNVHREEIIGAYYEEKLIGFLMLGDAGRFGLPGQILSSIDHRDKSPNNALIAKAVEVCIERGLDHLIYFYWSNDSLAEFKRRCGFQRVQVPRYYVPLTGKGRLALKYSLHRGWKALLPEDIKSSLKNLRKRWYN